MGERVENVSSGVDCYSVRQPLGVTAAGGGGPFVCSSLAAEL